jgi:hypothetical protein
VQKIIPPHELSLGQIKAIRTKRGRPNIVLIGLKLQPNLLQGLKGTRLGALIIPAGIAERSAR